MSMHFGEILWYSPFYSCCSFFMSWAWIHWHVVLRWTYWAIKSISFSWRWNLPCFFYFYILIISVIYSLICFIFDPCLTLQSICSTCILLVLLLYPKEATSRPYALVPYIRYVYNFYFFLFHYFWSISDSFSVQL